MDRRTLIKTAALAGLPAGVAAAALSTPMKPGAVQGAALPAGPTPVEILRKAPPVDLDRARALRRLLVTPGGPGRPRDNGSSL